MSITITRAGILDIIQDTGRFGHQHLGINPTGVMDPFAAGLANALAGNDAGEAVIELHFPASSITFDRTAIIAITGAEFSAMHNTRPVAVNSVFLVKDGDELRFSAPRSGSRCYLAIHGGFKINPWLNSKSTHLNARLGGFNGRKLQIDDTITFQKTIDVTGVGFMSPVHFSSLDPTISLPPYSNKQVRIHNGRNWSSLTPAAKDSILNHPFTISYRSDRMGCLLEGPEITRTDDTEMLSIPVDFGTIQLLPNRQLIILLADHQTTGGYPQIGHVITADLPILAQKKPGDEIRFELIGQLSAEQTYIHYAVQSEQWFRSLSQKVNTRLYENH